MRMSSLPWKKTYSETRWKATLDSSSTNSRNRRKGRARKLAKRIPSKGPKNRSRKKVRRRRRRRLIKIGGNLWRSGSHL